MKVQKYSWMFWWIYLYTAMIIYTFINNRKIFTISSFIVSYKIAYKKFVWCIQSYIDSFHMMYFEEVQGHVSKEINGVELSNRFYGHLTHVLKFRAFLKLRVWLDGYWKWLLCEKTLLFPFILLQPFIFSTNT